MANISLNNTYISFPLTYHRGNAIPLDDSSVYYSENELKIYAKESPVSYFGQVVSLVDDDNGKIQVYGIKNRAGDLHPLSLFSDEKTVTISDKGVVSLNDFGNAYYKYDKEEKKYEKKAVSLENPWKEDLIPITKRNNAGIISLAWIEPSDALKQINETTFKVDSLAKNAIHSITLGEEELISVENKVNIPVFNGNNVGLVSASTLEVDKAKQYLNAKGEWGIIPLGDLEAHGKTFETVTEYVNERMSWLNY